VKPSDLATLAVLAALPAPALSQPAAPAAFPQRRWSPAQAWDWYKKLPWQVGFNFVPSTAANTTEFWSADTFDEQTIDGELGWAVAAGFNSCRVFVQFHNHCDLKTVISMTCSYYGGGKST